MYGRCPRWGRLLLFAVLNLALWLGLAAGVALLASDDRNLGIETLLRHGQATAVTYLQRPPAAPGGGNAARDATQAIAAREVGGAESATPKPSRELPAEQPAGPTPAPTAPLPAGGGEPANPGPATPAAPGIEPAPAASSPARPLVLSDPGFGGLMQTQSTVASAAPGRRVEIHYDEAVLNREIEALLAQAEDLPYRNVQVSVRPDRLLVTAEIRVLGLNVNAELLGTLMVQDCALRVDVGAVSVGGVLTPRFIKKQASDIALRALNWYPADSPVCLDAVELGQGSLTVYGYRR